MTWCRQATSHYLSQCWPRSMWPYGVTRPQWVKTVATAWLMYWSYCSPEQCDLWWLPSRLWPGLLTMQLEAWDSYCSCIDNSRPLHQWLETDQSHWSSPATHNDISLDLGIFFFFGGGGSHWIQLERRCYISNPVYFINGSVLCFSIADRLIDLVSETCTIWPWNWNIPEN